MPDVASIVSLAWFCSIIIHQFPEGQRREGGGYACCVPSGSIFEYVCGHLTYRTIPMD